MSFHRQFYSIEYHQHQLQNQRSLCSPLCERSNVKQQSCGVISNKALLHVCIYACMYGCMHEQSTNHIYLKRKGLDVMQNHLLCSIHAMQVVTNCNVHAIGLYVAVVTIHFSGLLTKPDWPGCHNHGTIFICWYYFLDLFAN